LKHALPLSFNCGLQEGESASSGRTQEHHLPGSLPGILLGTLQSSSGIGTVGPADSPHILHYAHELARREVDISTLRKTRNKLENALSDMTKMLATERERHSEETLRLRETIARYVCVGLSCINNSLLSNHVIIAFDLL
jgi:hypothetical protein